MRCFPPPLSLACPPSPPPHAHAHTHTHTHTAHGPRYNAGYFAAVGGVEAVLASLKLAPSNPMLAAAAANGLNRMGLSHPQNLQRTVDAGSIPACVGSLTNLLDNERVVEANLSFLATIATDPANVVPIVQHGGVQALILSLYRNPECAAIQVSASRLPLHFMRILLTI